MLDRHNQRWSYLKDGKEITAPVDGNLVVNGGDMVTKMAISGLGIGFLPNFFVDQAIADNQLVSILDDFKHVTYPLSLLYPQNRQKARS